MPRATSVSSSAPRCETSGVATSAAPAASTSAGAPPPPPPAAPPGCGAGSGVSWRTVPPAVLLQKTAGGGWRRGGVGGWGVGGTRATCWMRGRAEASSAAQHSTVHLNHTTELPCGASSTGTPTERVTEGQRRRGRGGAVLVRAQRREALLLAQRAQRPLQAARSPHKPGGGAEGDPLEAWEEVAAGQHAGSLNEWGRGRRVGSEGPRVARTSGVV